MVISFGKNRKKKEQTLREQITAEIEQKYKRNELFDRANNSPFPNSVYGKNTLEYKTMLEHLDLAENIGLLNIRWGRYHTYQIMQMCYNHGMVAFVKDNMGIVTMAQVIPVSWAENGYIHEFTCLQSFQNRNRLDPNKKYINHVNGVILYDTFGFSHAPRAGLARRIINDMCDLFQRLQDNLLLAGDRMVFGNIDIQNTDAIKAELTKQFASGNPFLLFDQMVGEKLDGLKTDPKFVEIWNNLKQFDAFRQRLHGIGNGQIDNQKQNDYTNEAEVQANTGATNCVLNSRKVIFQEWVDEMKNILNENITVEWNI